MSLFASKDPKKEEEEEGDENPEAAEVTAEFKPLVSLTKRDLVTGEENEDATHTIRVKLLEFGETLLNIGSGKKEWKEKGVGDLKILKDKITSKSRILVRQEKTLKIIANFYCDHRLPDLKPNAGSDKAWCLNTPVDMSDEKPTSRTFCIKFNTAESCAEFKTKYDATRAEMKTIFESKVGVKEESSTGGGGVAGAGTTSAKVDEVDKAADALSKVSIAEGSEKKEGGEAP